MEADFSLKDATIGIIGLGLMGGSLVMSLKGKCARIIGFDSHPPTLELALSKKIIDQVEQFDAAGRVRRYRDHNIDVLIIATPVSTIIDILQGLSSFISSPCIVMDLGSTKAEILQAMSGLSDNFDPIGGHPICGKEKLGLENADGSLYKDTPFVVIHLERTTQKARSAVEQIVSAAGANLIEMTAEEHDRTLASTSHMPFLLSSALAQSTPQEYSSLIGPGFRSTSRLADTPSHMMMGILRSNRENVLGAIHSFRNSLDGIESSLQNEDYTELEKILDLSRESYLSIIST